VDKSDRLPSYFRGGGYSSDFLTEGGMPVTMSRLNLVKGVGPVLQIAEGAPPCPMRCTTSWTSAPTRPRVQGTRALHLVRPPPGKGPFKDVYSVMAAWGANHGAVCYGHVGADLITLASIRAS